MFTQGIINDSKSRRPLATNSMKDYSSITGLAIFESNYVISIEANNDLMKVWDVRMFTSFIEPYYYNLIEDDYILKSKLESSNAKICKNKHKKQPKEPIMKCSFNSISALLLKEERIKEKFTLSSRFNKPLLSYHKPVVGEEMSDDLTGGISYTSEESILSTKESISLRKVQNEIQRNSIEIKGYSSIHIDQYEKYLLVSSVNGQLYVYSLRHLDSQAPKIYGTQKASYYTKAEISSCSGFIGSGNSDGSVAIWDMEQPGVVHKYESLDSHEINGFSWMKTPYQYVIAAGGDDGIISILN